MVKTIITFIYRTIKLEQKDVLQIAEELPVKIRTDMQSTWDYLIEKGQAEGIKIGQAKGIKIGEAKGIKIGEQKRQIRDRLEFTLNLLRKLPNWTDAEIADVTEVEPEYVERVRSVFSKKRRKTD